MERFQYLQHKPAPADPPPLVFDPPPVSSRPNLISFTKLSHPHVSSLKTQSFSSIFSETAPRVSVEGPSKSEDPDPKKAFIDNLGFDFAGTDSSQVFVRPKPAERRPPLDPNPFLFDLLHNGRPSPLKTHSPIPNRPPQRSRTPDPHGPEPKETHGSEQKSEASCAESEEFNKLVGTQLRKIKLYWRNPCLHYPYAFKKKFTESERVNGAWAVWGFVELVDLSKKAIQLTGGVRSGFLTN